MNINVDMLKPKDLLILKADAYKEIVVTGYTALYQASKNQEVVPLTINDISTHFLKG